MELTLKQSAWLKARTLTMLFEGTNITPVTGNFDGQYLSLGIIQFCLGQNTLQPLLKTFFNTYPTLTTELGLDDFKWAINNGTEKTFAVNVLNNGGTSIVSPWRQRLTNMCNTNEWKMIEMTGVQSYINTAINLCNKYLLYTDRAFCLMFDIAVQMGSIPYKPLNATTYVEKLVEIANFTASRANSRWQNDVRKRKLAFAYGKDMGRGWDNSIVFDDISAFEELEVIEDMNGADVRKILGINDASSLKSEVDKAIEKGLLNSAHDANELPPFAILMTILNRIDDRMITKMDEINKKVDDFIASHK